MEMKLLKDEVFYAIKVDYFMINEKDEEYTEPLYLSIDTETKNKDGEPMNLIVFDKEITPRLRTFCEKREAKIYMAQKSKNTCSFENPRVVKITYNFETNKWEEC